MRERDWPRGQQTAQIAASQCTASQQFSQVANPQIDCATSGHCQADRQAGRQSSFSPLLTVKKVRPSPQSDQPPIDSDCDPLGGGRMDGRMDGWKEGRKDGEKRAFIEQRRGGGGACANHWGGRGEQGKGGGKRRLIRGRRGGGGAVRINWRSRAEQSRAEEERRKIIDRRLEMLLLLFSSARQHGNKLYYFAASGALVDSTSTTTTKLVCYSSADPLSANSAN